MTETKWITIEQALKIVAEKGVKVKTKNTITTWCRKYGIGELTSAVFPFRGNPRRWRVDESKLISLLKEGGYE